MLIKDPFFSVSIDRAASSPYPEIGIWNAQHICVAESRSSEDTAPANPGKSVVKHQLEGGKGHYSVAAAAFAKINCFGFPHDAIVQLRTHHTSGSDVRFLVQSNRYTSQRFLDVAVGKLNPEAVFYSRPMGKYRSRNGFYEQTNLKRTIYYNQCVESCEAYARLIEKGDPPEEARRVLAQGIRQDFTIMSTLKGHWHWLDQRSKADAQLEITALAEMVQAQLEQWAPTLSAWYKDNRWGKAILAP